MKTITMVELRTKAPEIMQALRKKGERFRLFYRGEALADLIPVDSTSDEEPLNSDPFYLLWQQAETEKETPLNNNEIDELLYNS